MIEEMKKLVYQQVVEEALKSSKMPTSESYIESFPNMNAEEKTKELLTPRVLAHKEGDVYSIFLRFVEDDFLIVEGIYYPHLAAETFFDTAKIILKDYYGSNESDLEEYARKEAVKMLTTLLRTTYERISITLGQIVGETIIDWRKQEWETYAQTLLPEGVTIPKATNSKTFDKHTKLHNKDVKRLWKKVEKEREDWGKLRLAEEYPNILGHWQTLHRASRENPDWREYSKAGKFFDTPDDLLDSLIDTESTKLSHIAIEHTARRVGLINIHSKNDVHIEKWKKGIKITGYAAQHLLDLKTEGDRLVEKSRSGEIKKTSEQKPQSVRTKKYTK